jgi:hypothetical protein
MTTRTSEHEGRRHLLLVLDYPGRREEARVADLALEERGCEVRYLLGPPFSRETTARAYAVDLFHRHELAGAEVAAVVAYCAAAAIGQEIAALLGGTVPLILFDGEATDAESVRRQYRATARQVADQLGAGDRAGDDRLDVPVDTETLARQPQLAIGVMRESLAALGGEALADGEDEDESWMIAESLADFYMDWLTYVVATHHAAWPRWGGDVLHIVSRDAVVGDWPGAQSTRIVRIDVPRADLLTAPAAAAGLVEFVAATTQAQRIDA